MVHSGEARAAGTTTAAADISSPGLLAPFSGLLKYVRLMPACAAVQVGAEGGVGQATIS
jgi:hypothetical protein